MSSLFNRLFGSGYVYSSLQDPPDNPPSADYNEYADTALYDTLPDTNNNPPSANDYEDTIPDTIVTDLESIREHDDIPIAGSEKPLEKKLLKKRINDNSNASLKNRTTELKDFIDNVSYTKFFLIFFFISTTFCLLYYLFIKQTNEKYGEIIPGLGIGSFALIFFIIFLFGSKTDPLYNNSVTLNIKKRKIAGIGILGVSIITLELLKNLSLYYNTEKNSDNNIIIQDINKYYGSFMIFNLIQFLLLFSILVYYLTTPVNKKNYFYILLLCFICIGIPNFVNLVSRFSDFKNNMLYSIYIISSILFLTVVVLPLISFFYPNNLSINIFGKDDSISEFDKDKNFTTSENLIDNHQKIKEKLYDKIKNINPDNIEFLNENGENINIEDADKIHLENKNSTLTDTLEERSHNGDSNNNTVGPVRHRAFQYRNDVVERLIDSGLSNVSISNNTSDVDKKSIESLIKEFENSNKRVLDSGILAKGFKEETFSDITDVETKNSQESLDDKLGKSSISYYGDGNNIKGDKNLYLTEEGDKNINYNLTNYNIDDNEEYPKIKIFLKLYLPLLIYFASTVWASVVTLKNDENETKFNTESTIMNILNMIFPIIIFCVLNINYATFGLLYLFSLLIIMSSYIYIPDNDKDNYKNYKNLIILSSWFTFIIMIFYSWFTFNYAQIKFVNKTKHLSVYEKNFGYDKDGYEHKVDENTDLFKV